MRHGLQPRIRPWYRQTLSATEGRLPCRRTNLNWTGGRRERFLGWHIIRKANEAGKCRPLVSRAQDGHGKKDFSKPAVIFLYHAGRHPCHGHASSIAPEDRMTPRCWLIPVSCADIMWPRPAIGSGGWAGLCWEARILYRNNISINMWPWAHVLMAVPTPMCWEGRASLHAGRCMPTISGWLTSLSHWQ
jgi:hypothetical protein